jgi:hypothetical protein
MSVVLVPKDNIKKISVFIDGEQVPDHYLKSMGLLSKFFCAYEDKNGSEEQRIKEGKND